MSEKLPPEISDSENLRTILTGAEDLLKENSESETSSSLPSNLESEQQNETASTSGSSKLQEEHRIEENNEAAGQVDPSQDGETVLQESNRSSLSDAEASVPPQSSENESKSMDSSRPGREGDTQVIEQFEPGVYVTLIVKPGGIKVFKRVRFSKRRFHEHQAEEWWNKNKDRVLRKYTPHATNLVATTTPPPAEENIEAAPS